mgnify:FL=1
MSIKRPFLTFTIGEIESLFVNDKDNLVLIRQINNELECRKSKRSKKLKKEINAMNVVDNSENKKLESVNDNKNVKDRHRKSKEIVNNLIMAGKDKGYLTHVEISEMLPKNLLTQEQIKPIISILKDLDIVVSNGYPDDLNK